MDRTKGGGCAEIDFSYSLVSGWVFVDIMIIVVVIIIMINIVVVILFEYSEKEREEGGKKKERKYDNQRCLL